jgi:hypothetical protein
LNGIAKEAGTVGRGVARHLLGRRLVSPGLSRPCSSAPIFAVLPLVILPRPLIFSRCRGKRPAYCLCYKNK